MCIRDRQGVDRFLPSAVEQLYHLVDGIVAVSYTHLKDFNQKGKWIAAICAGPIALEKAGVIENKQFTCYPGFESEIPSGIYQDSLTCIDQNRCV